MQTQDHQREQTHVGIFSQIFGREITHSYLKLSNIVIRHSWQCCVCFEDICLLIIVQLLHDRTIVGGAKELLLL